MRKCFYLLVMAVMSFAAHAEVATTDLSRRTSYEFDKPRAEATTGVVSLGKSSLRKAGKKAPSLNAAPADIAGQYIYTTLTRSEINSSGMVTITAGESAGTYLVTGLHEMQSNPVVGTYSNGTLTIAPGQIGYSDDTFGNVPLYQMVDENTYNSSADIVLKFDGSGSVELTSGVGFYMPIVEGEYSNYALNGTSTGGYFAYTPNGSITSHMVNSDFTDADPSTESYPTYTGFYEEAGVTYALVAGIDGVTFFNIQINADNSVQVLQEACYYYSSSYKNAYPCQGVKSSTTGAFNFYSNQGPAGTIAYQAGTITLDMWFFAMQQASGTSYSSVLGRKNPSVITFPGFTPDIPVTTEFNCTTTGYSKFVEESLVNSYKNTLALRIISGTASSYVNKTRTVYRTNKATGEKTEVCTISFTQRGKNYNYAIAYSSPMATDNALRYDALALPAQSGQYSSSTISVADYFTASTAGGGDKAGEYVYTVESGRLGQVKVYAADIYVWPSTADGIDAYTLEQITEDTDHALDPQGGYTIYLADYSEGIERVHGYLEHEYVGSADFHTLLLLENEVTTVANMSTALVVGNNTYGTNVATAYAAVLGDVNAYNKVKSEYTFNDGSRYFTCLINAALNSDPDASFETTGGGFRVWRTCETSDEVYESLSDRADDYLFFDNVGSSESASFVENIGSEKMSLNGINYTSGMFGSTSETPTAIMRVRAYYKASDSANAPRKVKAKDVDDEVYLIAENIFEVTFESSVITGLKEMTGVRAIKDINYYNSAGQVSKTPHKGVNLTVITYEDGTTSTRKQIVR